ncbi:Mediator of RNA polymerase II transcription subunit 21, partial [Ananas comosus]
ILLLVCANLEAFVEVTVLLSLHTITVEYNGYHISATRIGNTIAMLALNTFGTLRRDAPPVRLSPDYPEPPATNPSEETVNVAEQSKAMSAALVQAAKKFDMLVVALPLSGENAQLKRIVNENSGDNSCHHITRLALIN